MSAEAITNMQDLIEQTVTGTAGYLPNPNFECVERHAVKCGPEERDALDLQTHLGFMEVIRKAVQFNLHPQYVWWFVADAAVVRQASSGYLSSPKSGIQAWKRLERDPEWKGVVYRRECDFAGDMATIRVLKRSIARMEKSEVAV
ncbi:hypothetical protein HYU45_05010 [Candidatus Daviesbacteria bacterium]|nr:hypothetical protein [Candidatus Daviesbacteria bacterium]